MDQVTIYTFLALIGRAMSTSYIPKQGEIATKFIQDLQQLYKQHKNSNGLVYLKYQCYFVLTLVRKTKNRKDSLAIDGKSTTA